MKRRQETDNRPLSPYQNLIDIPGGWEVERKGIMKTETNSGHYTDPDFIDTWSTSTGELRLVPMDYSAGFFVRPGIYELKGAHAIRGGVNFTIHSAGATEITLLLFHRGEREPYARIPFPKQYRIGKVWAMIVFDLDIQEFEYAYSVNGPWQPEKGLLFDPSKPLLDIYARAVTGQSVWGVKNPGFYKARVVRPNFDWGKEHFPRIRMEDLVIYELHVRGFTWHASSKVSCPGTFRGLIEKIPYLKALGVNAVELMPVFEFDECADERTVNGKRLLNYWGYNPISFFAPNTSYASTQEFNREGEELKTLIRELHKNDIECILDVVYNHTAEGNSNGPVISFKGFDNQIYYLLTPDGKYYDFSGCGNSVNCNHPVVQDLILDSLRYWTTAYHIDGFRFDLASILGRNEDGTPMSNPPLLERLACDPVLYDAKLIAEAWDAGGLYQIGGFNYRSRWAEWNGRYRDDLRNFLKGDFGLWKNAAARITGSRDIFDPEKRGYQASVNFITCHDGFTLNDLYSYAYKHNEANGWCNADGTDDNRSWNCGSEGRTSSREINYLRRKLIRNALTVLLLSRGTPMLLSGDEFMNSQGGNNNAYCQDNEVSWLNWDDLKANQDLHDYVQTLISFRKDHPVIRRRSGQSSLGFPEIQVLEPHGDMHTLGIVYAGKKEDNTAFLNSDTKTEFEDAPADDVIVLAINVYWKPQSFHLPDLPEGRCFQVAADTALAADNIFENDTFKRSPSSITGGGRIAAGTIEMEPRSVQVFNMVPYQENDLLN